MVPKPNAPEVRGRIRWADPLFRHALLAYFDCSTEIALKQQKTPRIPEFRSLNDSSRVFS
jgi:hypothetical protein